MKLLSQGLGALFITSFLTLPCFGWTNRPNVIRAADKLAEEVEHLDTALHTIATPKHIIDKVHHFEETVMEFAEAVRTCPFQEANQEMAHIRSDVQIIRNEFNSHPELLRDSKVAMEWKAVRTSYRYLDHEMFYFNSQRWTKEKTEQLTKDLEEMKAVH